MLTGCGGGETAASSLPTEWHHNCKTVEVGSTQVDHTPSFGTSVGECGQDRFVWPTLQHKTSEEKIKKTPNSTSPRGIFLKLFSSLWDLSYPIVSFWFSVACESRKVSLTACGRLFVSVYWFWLEVADPVCFWEPAIKTWSCRCVCNLTTLLRALRKCKTLFLHVFSFSSSEILKIIWRPKIHAGMVKYWSFLFNI